MMLDRDHVKKCLAFWSGASLQNVCDSLADETVNEIAICLGADKLPLSQRVLRSVLSPCLLRISSDRRLMITNMLKVFRNPQRKLHLRSLLDLLPNRTVLDLRMRSGKWLPPWPVPHSFVICLTHDVDYATCYEFVDHVVQAEIEAGVVATYNFLTHSREYAFSQEKTAQLVAQGFEVGVHGDTHDIGLGERGDAHLLRRLRSAFAGVPKNEGGFRAPALSTSDRLLHILDRVGCRYDSSLQTAGCFYPSVGFSFPYIYAGTRIWEVPLTIQDDLFFRDAKVSYSGAMTEIMRLAEETAELGGVMVVNFHPHLIRSHMSFFKDLLAYLRSLPAWFTLLGNLCEYMERFRGEFTVETSGRL